MTRVLVLGAAAGGGFPQWNSNSEANRRVRARDSAAPAATQASIAVSANGADWYVINASPDLREQINRERSLHPRTGVRSSPIAGVVLTNGDVDAIAGLLHLRERTAFTIHAHRRILDVIEANPIFRVLDPDLVHRAAFGIGQEFVLARRAGEEAELRVMPFAVPGKIALFMEDGEDDRTYGTREGDTIGLDISDSNGRSRVVYVANCAAVDDKLRARCDGAAALFFDGTLWQDDEMIVRGEGAKTGRRMGHVSMSGPEGAIAAFAGIDVGRRVFIHINNTNPALLADSNERAELEAGGWEVAYDGMVLDLP